VLEGSGRRLRVLVSLVVGTWCSSVVTGAECPKCLAFARAETLCQTDMAQCSWDSNAVDLRAAAAGLLEPPAEAGSGGACLPSLPAGPRPVAMVLFGFLCVSLVRDRGTWLALTTSVLSLGQYGAGTDGMAPGGREYSGWYRYWTTPEVDDAVREWSPPWIVAGPVVAKDVAGGTGWSTPQAIISPDAILTRPWPCLVIPAIAAWPSPSQLVLAQVARGPPPRAGEISFMPTFE
jgi:hypothetical protein